MCAPRAAAAAQAQPCRRRSRRELQQAAAHCCALLACGTLWPPMSWPLAATTRAAVGLCLAVSATAAAAVATAGSSSATSPAAVLTKYPCPFEHSWCHDNLEEDDFTVIRNVSYGTAFNRLSGKDQPLLLDIYTPRKQAQATGDGGSSRHWPVAVLIHGGGWKSQGDFTGKDTKRTEAKYFVRRGFVAVSIDYRCERAFGGDWLWLDAVADARLALRWLAAHTETYRFDMSRLVVYGTSAGAITVEGLCYMHQDPNVPLPPRISAAISVSGALFNDSTSVCTPHEKSNSTCFPPPGAHVWNRLYNHSASPRSPPLIDFHGTADPTVPFDNARNRPATKRNQSCSAIDTRAFVSAAGAPNDLVPIPGAGHVPLSRVFAPPFNTSFWGFLVAKMGEPNSIGHAHSLHHRNARPQHHRRQVGNGGVGDHR
jgi:acetyl esterase/lipase